MNNNNEVDAKGTTQAEAKKMLETLSRKGFSQNTDELALALGRDSEEIENILSGDEIVDDDLAMKIRGIAQERNIEIE